MWHGRVMIGEVDEVLIDNTEAFATCYDQPWRYHAGIDEQIDVEAESTYGLNGPRFSRLMFN